MRKYFVIVLAFFTFCSNDGAITDDYYVIDCSEIEKNFSQMEESIEELESKDSLTLEEEQELENLMDRIVCHEEYVKEAEDDYEDQPFDEEELTDFNDPIVAKYFTENEADPSYNPGKFLPRHCTYEGRYEDIYYEETPVLEVPFKDELILDLYPETLGLFSEGLFPRNIVDYGGEYGEQLGEFKCQPDWSFSSSFGGDVVATNNEPDETKRQDFYGLSFYDRIFPFYSVTPAEQQGLWGQWIQAPDSHPYGPAGGSIEGGLGVYDKFGRTKYPIYMASGATLYYNPNSSFYGWGFYETRVPCDCYGGVQLTNKVLNLPNAIHFDEDQNEYNEDGGIYFGHGWFALPIFSGDKRVETQEPTTDTGKLTWTFIANTAQYSGPMWAYVPEFWHRRIDRWNALEMILDGEDQISEENYQTLIDFLGNKIDKDTLYEEISDEEWFISDVEEFDQEQGGVFWVDEKNTLAYTTTEYAAIGSEMGELPAFTEYDNDGNLYLKIFPPSVPSTGDKEYFTLDGRIYDINLYNHFVDFFSGSQDLSDMDPSFLKFSKPLVVERTEKARPDLEMSDLFVSTDSQSSYQAETLDGLSVSWNVVLTGETNNGETNMFWDWSGTNSEDRDLSQYYKVEINGSSEDFEDYIFTPVDESEVPGSLQVLEMSTLERTVSYMPHIKTAQDSSLEAEIKSDIDESLGIDSTPLDFSCWDCESEGCDPEIYESVLDDGSKIKYRWYRFKDQPSFKYLKIDYPDIYTDEYLDLVQSRVEQMHKEWGPNQEFIANPETLENFHLVELDNGSVVKPPVGKEVGWVPIVLELEIPYGEYQDQLHYNEFMELYGERANEFSAITMLP